MNREIKFRFWNRKLRRMSKVYGVGVIWEGLCDEWDIFDWSDVETLQYTGRKDKSGVWIFKGDVLVSDDYPFWSDGQCNYRGVVDWFERDACWYLDLYVVSDRVRGGATGGMLAQYAEHSEIIGNVHENPELLEASPGEPA